eukprot:3147878-Karenia_brevis.AAC.1
MPEFDVQRLVHVTYGCANQKGEVVMCESRSHCKGTFLSLHRNRLSCAYGCFNDNKCIHANILE